VTLALHAYQELIERNFRFTLPPDSKLFMESFALRGNVLGGFLEECCVCEPGARVFNTELYAAFAAFCKRNGVDCIPRKQFYELLSGIPYIAAKRLRIGTENRQRTRGYSPKRI
jgi:putative DNA primase/helicase